MAAPYDPEYDSDSDPTSAPQLPLVWRIPPWQPAGLILLATILLGLDLYADLNLGPLVLTAGIAAASLVGAVFAVRLSLVADEHGIWVRKLLRERLVAWPDVDQVNAVPVSRNNMTIRIDRRQGGFLEVPTSLLLPAVPTNVRVARTRVHTIAQTLSRLADQQRAA